MCLVGALVPHYIIGIALGAGAYGMFMLCEGAFKVKDDIPPWFIWVHYLGYAARRKRGAIDRKSVRHASAP
eukprot:5868776-Prymnesium_polylepis.1